MYRDIIGSRACPKCGERNSLAHEDCRSCGVVFAKYPKHRLDEEPPPELAGSARQELFSLWQAIIEDYENEGKHEQFIETCRRLDVLTFASRKYGRILSASPEEEVANRMHRRVEGLVSCGFVARAASVGGWSFRIPKLNSLAIFLGSMVTTIGFLLPDSKRITAMGASMLVLSFFIRSLLSGGGSGRR